MSVTHYWNKIIPTLNKSFIYSEQNTNKKIYIIILKPKTASMSNDSWCGCGINIYSTQHSTVSQVWTWTQLTSDHPVRTGTISFITYFSDCAAEHFLSLNLILAQVEKLLKQRSDHRTLTQSTDTQTNYIILGRLLLQAGWPTSHLEKLWCKNV